MLLGASLARAGDTPREAGAKLRDELSKKAPVAALEGTVELPAYLGLSRVGELTLSTKLVEKGGEALYHLEDSLSFDATGLGSIDMRLTADLGADFSVRELVLYTSRPGPTGAITRRKLTVTQSGDGLSVSDARDEEKPVTTSIEGAGKRSLLLTPPLGIGERLVRLAKGEVGQRFSLEAHDLAHGTTAVEGGRPRAFEAPGVTLAISCDEVAKIDIRGASLEAQKVTRGEGALSLEEWLVPGTREPLKLATAGAERLTFVGRESSEKKEDLPGPAAEARAKEGPALTVLRFLRASGRGDAAEVESLLDVHALFTAAKPADTSEKFEETYKKTLVQMLTGPEWRRSGSVALLAGAVGTGDLVEKIDGARATVGVSGAEDAPQFELRQSSAGWKIDGLPRRR